MIKRVTWIFIAAVLLALSFPAIASAHVLKIDGNIGAILHIEPDDNPTTGQRTTYVLAFSDQTRRLDLSKCTCGVNIIENGKIIYAHPLHVSDPADSVDTYTFPQPAVYTMEITGRSTTSGAFQSFKLDYEVRVGQTNTQQFPALLWVGIGMGIGLVLLAAYATSYDSDAVTKKLNRSHQ